MKTRLFGLSMATVLALLLTVGGVVPALAGDKDKESKKEEKALNKEAKKLGNTAEEAGEELGRDKVFCVLAAHTSVENYETAQQLKDKFESLTDFPFGQFVAAVLLADRADHSLDDILARLPDSSIGKLTKEFGHNMGEMRKEFNEMRKELGRSMTNPPTRDCFSTTP